jgi:hypothetical protein
MEFPLHELMDEQACDDKLVQVLHPEGLGCPRPRRRRCRPTPPGRGGSVVNTDEWGAYRHLPQADRLHRTVNHNPRGPEWARDDDGDGIREVHGNTMEGIWTGLRNFLRPFRGVSKWYLDQ